MNGLTAADFADTGQWRLIVRIYRGGISAHLENTLHEGLEPQLLFASSWEPGEGTLLQNIENAVYDHPRVLDDFSACILVFDRRTAFMPTELVEEAEGAEETYYSALYSADPADILTDTDGDLTAAYSPAPGLKGFLSRTFPGARVECNLMNQVRRLRRVGTGLRLFVTMRPDEADFILLDGENLISASTRAWLAGPDIVYYALNLADAYGYTMSDISVKIAGENVPEEGVEFFNRQL